MRTPISIICVVLVSGCATAPPKYFRGNTTQADFQKDVWECQQIVNQSYQAASQSSSPGGAGAAIGHMMGRAMSEKGRHQDCMYGRGYQLQP